MNPRILIVDDDLRWRGQFQDIIATLGFTADTAREIDDAKNRLRQGDYDLILLDIFLSEPPLLLECQQFCDFLRRTYPNLPIVVTTGRSLDPDEVFALAKLGVFAFVLKPKIQLDDFRLRIQAALEVRTSLEEPRVDPLFAFPRISMLFLAADPSDASRLRLGEEAREIQEKLQMAALRDRFVMHQRFAVRPIDLSQALLDVKPQIVHFSGHGTTTGALCVENHLGNTHLIQPPALATLFEQFADIVQCVILNACYSQPQALAIAEHIEYVIGIDRTIIDEAAIAFSVGFYQALGAGRTIDQAFRLGCVQIRLQSMDEHLTPVLIRRNRVHL